jgi:hypothetical protein
LVGHLWIYSKHLTNGLQVRRRDVGRQQVSVVQPVLKFGCAETRDFGVWLHRDHCSTGGMDLAELVR